jgi:pimeloyl-ACP methyl ester carboxylesterase
MWSVAFGAVLVGIGIYLALTVVLYLLQSRLLYFPMQEIVWTPSDFGITYEEATFRAADGTALHGWFVPAEGSAGVILFCHGNGGNISYLVESIQVFHRLGLSTFVFDYRGYGRSDGTPSEEGTYSDAQGALQYLTEELWRRGLRGPQLQRHSFLSHLLPHFRILPPMPIRYSRHGCCPVTGTTRLIIFKT